ncbi:MAG: helix-turn-helix domain-containing protein [Flavobacteriaceae bacterium]
MNTVTEVSEADRSGTLHSVRIALKLSIEEISSLTGLRVKEIEALESEQATFFPSSLGYQVKKKRLQAFYDQQIYLLENSTAVMRRRTDFTPSFLRG